jgi:hypothetical protein
MRVSHIRIKTLSQSSPYLYILSPPLASRTKKAKNRREEEEEQTSRSLENDEQL